MEPQAITTSVLHNLGDGACRTIIELETELDFTRRQISKSAAGLICRGYLERVEKGCFQLTTEGLNAASNGEEIKSGPWKPHTAISQKRRKSTLRQRVWNVMRMSTSFTYSDLEIAAAKQESVALNNIQKFMGALIKTGYVMQLPTRQAGTKLTSFGFKRFKLLNDTGPVVPTIRFTKKEVFDHNTQKVVSWS